MRADRLALLLALATFLFVGALRAFLAAVYYDNLVALELGLSALWSLALLAPVAFLAPALGRTPRIVLPAAALALALARAPLAFTRGSELHLPIAAVAVAAGLILLGALLPLLRASHVAPAAAGIATGWALDVALLWWSDSADITQTARGAILVAPVALLMAWTAWTLSRREMRVDARPGGWLAGAALGVWLFVQNTLAGNPYGAARWNGHEPGTIALASLAGLLVGAVLVVRVASWSRPALIALHAVAFLAILDHAHLHTGAFPMLLVALQTTLVIDLALLLPRVSPRALVLTGLVALLLHFLYAFTYLFAFVPLGDLWKGQAPSLYVIAGLALIVLALLRGTTWRAVDASARRPFTSLAVVPALIGVFAAATSGVTMDAPNDELRVASFNVHQGFSNDGVVDAEVFVRMLDEMDADIVALQEADTPRFTSGNLDVGGYLAQRAGYHHVYGQPTRAQAFGGQILSRYPVHEWHAYQLPSTSDDRWYTEARIDIGGTDVWVYAVHFALPHEGRIPQAEALLAQAATRPGPKLLIGDFNSCPNGLCPGYEEGVPDDVYAQVTATYDDAWVAAGHARDDSDGLTYETGASTERIDYVFVSRELEVLRAEVPRGPTPLAASDHLPVVADLRLRQ